MWDRGTGAGGWQRNPIVYLYPRVEWRLAGRDGGTHVNRETEECHDLDGAAIGCKSIENASDRVERGTVANDVLYGEPRALTLKGHGAIKAEVTEDRHCIRAESVGRHEPRVWGSGAKRRDERRTR